MPTAILSRSDRVVHSPAAAWVLQRVVCIDFLHVVQRVPEGHCATKPSQRQVEAHRLNAMQSTSPKSDIGKAVVVQNAMKHGIFSKKILLDGESKNEFQCLQAKFCKHFQPQNFLEKLFLERAITAAWRLSRITQKKK
jgi:hypothetical protein